MHEHLFRLDSHNTLPSSYSVLALVYILSVEEMGADVADAYGDTHDVSLELS